MEKLQKLDMAKIKEAQDQLEALQGPFERKINLKNSIIKEEVTLDDIAEVVGKWTGIPVKKKWCNLKREKLLQLEDELRKRNRGSRRSNCCCFPMLLEDLELVCSIQISQLEAFLFFRNNWCRKKQHWQKALAAYLFDDEKCNDKNRHERIPRTAFCE